MQESLLLDWTDWIFFLEMLSVERTEAFVGELELPFERERFPEVIRLARACLEVHILPTVNASQSDVEFRGLDRAWHHYREVEGVLDEDLLQNFVAEYRDLTTATQNVYSRLRSWVGEETGDALGEWFTHNFRSCPDPVWQWVRALRLMFCVSPQNISPTTVAPVTEDDRQRIRSFCTRYYGKQRDLEMRFWVISQAATATVPTLWESVLQAFQAGGLGNKYPWLGTVEQCLQLRLIRREWSRLNAELEHDTATRLVAWIKQQEVCLP